MKNRITLPIALSSLIGLGFVGGLVVSGQTAASGQDTAAPQAAVSALPSPAPAAPAVQSVAFAYKSPAFTEFVTTSYAESPNPDRPAFYPWMQSAYEDSHVRFKGLETTTNLDDLLTAIGRRYAAMTDPEQKTLLEKQTGAFCHKLIKKSIRHFSLGRGFEFYNVVDRGERQCFLQSTLIAGLMQRAGMNAGVAMVTKSDKGEESNNGHAATLVKLSNGNDLLVDASHKTPFIRQQGLMVADATSGGYRFVAPLYAADGDQIAGYGSLSLPNAPLKTAEVRPLGTAFLRSQFDYYRGERAPGGFFDKKKSPQGLADSERFFTRSIQEDPGNPLPSYALGRVELRLGDMEAARGQLLAAYQLYSGYGFVPQGAREALALVHAAPQAVSMR